MRENLPEIRVGGVVMTAETFSADTVVSVAQDIETSDDSALLVSSEGMQGGNYMEIVPA
jgi:phospholipid/cholesterol/gamma-HCH transport system substrate-binding protein